MSSARTILFVYGTLKRGCCRHRVLAGQQFLREAETVPHYRMVNVGTYPGLLVAQGEGRSIRGELWSVDSQCLASLDIVEGVDEGLYERREIQLVGFSEAVESYFFMAPAAHLLDCGTDWKDLPGQPEMPEL